MVKPTGIHHIAIMTGDMKAQLEFLTDEVILKVASYAEAPVKEEA
jgi:catechol 2,3-dioxygenase-like lactoylglutathione lyase family enzyme